MSSWENEEVQILANIFLGRNITITEVKLLPYLDYCLKNQGELSIEKVNREELYIMKTWEGKRWIDFHLNFGKLAVNRGFYIFMCNILWLTRCNQIKEQ